jgi:hypothetical protein
MQLFQRQLAGWTEKVLGNIGNANPSAARGDQVAQAVRVKA